MLLSKISLTWVMGLPFREGQYHVLSKVSPSRHLLNYLGAIYLLLLAAAIPLRAQNDLATQAIELMRTGKFHDAEMLWRQLEKQYPANAAVHSNLGVTLAQQGALELAAGEYRKS